jgi:hypothetical protein
MYVAENTSWASLARLSRLINMKHVIATTWFVCAFRGDTASSKTFGPACRPVSLAHSPRSRKLLVNGHYSMQVRLLLMAY